ncbi:RNA polymerase sigma factor [Brevibacillus sp. B_LB10_24]|uniref:RNA polymerase sigma factor n=1 Tax=Brevibacillus sp. B_LB10_24 TaxID=3380645 RepID=UPI0038BBAB3F
MKDMEQIYTEYFQTVYKYLFCLTRDANLSEELTQETFYQALKTVKNFRGQCKISVWLCQIAKHLWFKYWKKRNKLDNFPLDESEFTLSLSITEKAIDEILMKEEKTELYRKIQGLDEQTKEVMLLRITGGLSFREIGDILSRNETWARVTFYRGKQKLLREELK